MILPRVPCSIKETFSRWWYSSYEVCSL
jgi:hypothetical protein